MKSIRKSLGIKTEEEKRKDDMRKYKRLLTKSIRDIEKEMNSLKSKESKIILEIKKSARENQIDSAKIQAKSLIQTRKHIKKFHNMKAHLNAIEMQMTSFTGTANMTKMMRGVSGIMTKMNKQMNIPEMNNIMREFQKETEQLDLKEEILGETIDDALGMDDEDESDDILNQVLDEIGVTLSTSLKPVPQKSLSTPTKNPIINTAESIDTPENDLKELEKRLGDLKK
jgi:charged multivesicular body protein 2A